MNIKKFISVIAAAAIAAACLAVPSFADDETAAEEETTAAEEVEGEDDPDLEDIEMPVTRALQTNGMWGQSITYSQTELSADRFTEKTQILIEFEAEGEAPNGNAPVELILQNYSAEPQIWAKVPPAEYDETTAVFNYADMVAFYGMEDMSGVNNICIGDCGEKMKLTKFTVTNCKPKPVATTAATTTAAETEAATEAPVTEATATEAAETTAADPVAAEAEGSINMTIVVVIIVGVIVVAAAIVTIIVVKKSRKRFY